MGVLNTPMRQAAAVTALIALVYLPSLEAPFIFDDHDAIEDNASIRSLMPLSVVLSPPPDTPVAGRPLANLSFALSYAAFGLSPAGFRIGNLLLHALNAVLLLMLLRRLLLRPELPDWVREAAPGLALAATALFALHPLQTEAVAYLTQRTELLGAAFYLGTLLASVASFEARAPRPWQWLAIGLAALAPFAKETTASAPLLVLMIDRALYSPSIRSAWALRRRLYLGFGLSVMASLTHIVFWPRGQTAGFAALAPEYLATQGAVIARYLALAVWPVGQSVAHDFEVASPLHRYLPLDLAIAGLFVLTVWLSRRRLPLALPGWLLFAILAPSSSVIPVLTEVAAERRMYLPLAGLAVLAVVGGSCLLRRLRLPGGPIAVASVVLLSTAYGAASHARLRDYASEESIWRAALRVDPSNRIARRSLGRTLAKLGRYDEAVVLLAALTEDRRPFRGPASWGTRALLDVASIESDRGRPDVAARARQQALTHDPSSAIGRLQRASEAQMRGDLDAAERLLREVLQQPFLHGHAYEALADVRFRRGDTAGALAMARRALEEDPARPRARALLEALGR